MQAIETAWRKFYGQFAPHVFPGTDLIQDPTNTLYPRITFTYQVGDFLDNTVSTFEVWDWSHNSARVWDICNAIADAVPVGSGTGLDIPLGTHFEYALADGTTGRVETAEEMNDVIRREDVASWQEVSKGSAGSIEIWRGTPFLQPSPKDEPLLRVMYGILQAQYVNIV